MSFAKPFQIMVVQSVSSNRHRCRSPLDNGKHVCIPIVFDFRSILFDYLDDLRGNVHPIVEHGQHAMHILQATSCHSAKAVVYQQSELLNIILTTVPATGKKSQFVLLRL